MSDLLLTSLSWYRASKAPVPYRAEHQGQMLVVRINALTRYPDNHRFTLLCNARPVVEFDDWPAAWGMPPEPERSDWAALMHELPRPLCFVHDDGSEHAPDDPIGHNRLVLRGDGSVLLENRKSGQLRRWQARADSAALSSVISQLIAIGFPDLPLPRLVPGMSLRSVRLMTGQHFAGCSLVRHQTAPGSHEQAFCDLIDTLIAQASADTLYSNLSNTRPRMIWPE